jgi:hypothetical protein
MEGVRIQENITAFVSTDLIMELDSWLLTPGSWLLLLPL